MKVLLILLLFPAVLWGQTEVVNATSGVMKVNGVSVPSGFKKDLNVPVKNGVAELEVEYYNDNLQPQGPYKIYREVKRNRVYIRSFEPDVGLKTSFSKSSSSSSSSNQSSYNQPVSEKRQYAGSDWWATVTIKPENKMDGQTIFIPADPFKGLALKSGQTSQKSVTIETGPLRVPVLLQAEEGYAESGVKFSWALLNTIVTENQDVFQIKPEDIMQSNSGEIITKRIISELPFKITISEGYARGTVISPGKPQKLEMFLGWNIIPIEFDENGMPNGLLLMALVADDGETLTIKNKSPQDVNNVNDNVIIITDYRR